MKENPKFNNEIYQEKIKLYLDNKELNKLVKDQKN